MTEKEKKLLPVLGAALLFAVYWFFIRGGDDSPKRNSRRRPPAQQPAAPVTPGPGPRVATPAPPAPTAAVDAGVAVASTRVDAAPPPPPQEWSVNSAKEGRIEWVAPKGRVIKDDIVVKLRGYERAERQRTERARTFKRMQQRLNEISDKLRAAMTANDRDAMRRYERQILANQRDVARAEEKLRTATAEAHGLAIRAPGSGTFEPQPGLDRTLKVGTKIGMIRE